MSHLLGLPADRLTPSTVWGQLDLATRRQAAQAIYGDHWGEDRSMRREADLAIARTLRFREAAVRRLPLERRIDYLLRAVRADDTLASTLLMALHLGCRAAMLGTFLDDLGIPHERGLIDPEFDLAAPDPERLTSAVEHLRAEYDPAEVEAYLATLVAMDPGMWGALARVSGAPSRP